MASTTQTDPVSHAGIKLPVLKRETLTLHGCSYHWITECVCRVLENKQPLIWWLLFIPCSLITAIGVGGGLIDWISTGAAIWGNTNHVMWGWPIVNFVFWIGIGHAGMLISAILLLTRQNWRTSINRTAEAMTICALICAVIPPAFHVGRVCFAWVIAPVPNGIWLNFKSPLLSDALAVFTCFTIALIFCYIGMIPDLATIRDRCMPGRRKALYGIFSLGWRGGNRQWSHYKAAYLLLAALVVPLILSVHSIASCSLATSAGPGWRTTLVPPDFLSGTILSGFAMVLTLMLPTRVIYGLQDIITMKHIDNMARIILLTGTILGCSYLMEGFVALYSGTIYEMDAFKFQITGPYGWAYAAMISCNVLSPQVFWFRTCRENLWVVMIVAMLVNAGMWLERLVIIVGTLAHTWLPGDWKACSPSPQDQMLLLGTIGLFLTLYLMFLRLLPGLNITGIKQSLYQSAHLLNKHSDAAASLEPAYQIEAQLPTYHPVSTTLKRAYCYLAKFKGAADLYKAAETVRNAGFKEWDCYSPYPIHGLDSAMGMKRSILPWLAFCGGMTGTATAVTLAFVTQATTHPTLDHTKTANIFTITASFPIMCDLTILFAGLTVLVALLVLIRRPRLNHPLLESKLFRRVTDDGFFIAIEAHDPLFHPIQTRDLLAHIGSDHIELIEEKTDGLHAKTLDPE